MQIIFDEKEIQKALIQYAEGLITLSGNQSFSLEMKAGRGENGFTATLEIVETEAVVEAPQEEAPVKKTPVKRSTKATLEPVAETTTNPLIDLSAVAATKDAKIDAASTADVLVSQENPSAALTEGAGAAGLTSDAPALGNPLADPPQPVKTLGSTIVTGNDAMANKPAVAQGASLFDD